MTRTPAHRPSRRALAATVVALVVALSASWLPAGAALAQGAPTDPAPAPVPPPPPPDTVPPPLPVPPPPPPPPLPDPSPHIRTLLAQLALLDGQSAVSLLELSSSAAHRELDAASTTVATATAARDAADRDVEAKRNDLGSVAAFAYMHAGGTSPAASLQGDSTAAGRQRELLAASIEHGREELDAATARAGDAADALAGAREAEMAASQRASDADGALDAGRSQLDGVRRELASARANESRPTRAGAWALTIEGHSVFTAAELAQWYVAQGHGSQATVPVDELARLYVEQGDAENVRGDMAFAQSVHETGWFANTDTIVANNFAGIGHCDSCGGGFPFATAQIGVLAQIQLLKSYAIRDPLYALERAAPGLDGPSGCCTTWTRLGGVWASDPNYGPAILGRYQDMLEWLVAFRSAAAQPA